VPTPCPMIGIIKLALGLARLGALVNYISTTVIVGFTAGAGILIIAAQLRNFFGLHVPQSSSFFIALSTFAEHLWQVEPWTLVVGVITLAVSLAGRRWLPKVPYMLTGMIAGGGLAYLLSAMAVAHV